jgi:processive 1,2-diacylglycerol beta-glucosyltransferase
LASRLSAFGPERPEFVALLLAAADVHVTKAGGLTIAESLAMGVPLILANQFPGQERVNAETLVEFGAAAVGRNPEDCGRLAAGLLHNPVQRSLMAAAAARHGIPDSAARAARALEGDLTASFRPRISCGCST